MQPRSGDRGDSEKLIGFGFHEENINLLKLDQSHAEIHATDRGLPQPKKFFANELLKNLEWAAGSAADLVYKNISFAEVVTGRRKGTSTNRRFRQKKLGNLNRPSA